VCATYSDLLVFTAAIWVLKAYSEMIVAIYSVIKVVYPPTGAQVNCLKNNFKIYIKIDIKTAPTYFGAITNI
jgi:hypothetical protein